MPTQHTVKSFDEELQRLDNAIAEMGGLAEAQLAAAVECLLKRDAESAQRLVGEDKRIDALEQQVNAQAVRLFALRHPLAEDLRLVVTALKISSDLERIGDYAKNIAKRTTALSSAPPKSAASSLRNIGRLVQEMITSVLDAYLRRDVQRADAVCQRDAEVDALHTSLFRELLTYMMEDPAVITQCTHLLFVAKNIERIGDHATNIAEMVHYMVVGERPPAERPKDDLASVIQVDSGTARGGEG